MLSNLSFKKVHRTGRPGQAIVEFAIVLPILMVLLVGILEVGRMIFIYSAVNNASREASRFGSAVGFDDDGFHKYRHCAGIKEKVEQSAYLLNPANLVIDIRYDKGPNDPVYADGHGPDDATEWSLLTPCDLSSGEDTDVSLVDDVQYRILVSVSAPYSPLVSLVPISSRTFSSSSARTILGYVNLNSGSSSVSSGSEPDPGSVGGATYTPTPTETPVPTDTPTDTPTATATEIGDTSTPTDVPTETPTPGDLTTFTPLPTGTATDTPTMTPTFTATNTATATPTYTPTFTPTSTPTIVPGCDQITTSIIGMATNSNIVSLIITNPHSAITVSSIQFSWNAATGGPGKDGSLLTWQYASLGGITWAVNSAASGTTTTPPAVVTLPGNNTSSTLTITLDKIYKNPIPNDTVITVNFSTDSCNSITKTQ